MALLVDKYWRPKAIASKATGKKLGGSENQKARSKKKARMKSKRYCITKVFHIPPK